MPQGWDYNARRQLTPYTRADGSYVDLAYDETTTGHLESATYPVLGAVTFGCRALTGASEQMSDPSGCRQRTIFQDEVLPIGVVLEDATGGTCPVQGEVSATFNDRIEASELTVGGASMAVASLPSSSSSRIGDPVRRDHRPRRCGPPTPRSMTTDAVVDNRRRLDRQPRACRSISTSSSALASPTARRLDAPSATGSPITTRSHPRRQGRPLSSRVRCVGRLLTPPAGALDHPRRAPPPC